MARTYYTLAASFPPLPQTIDIERLPISRLRLNERLRMLDERDTQDLQLVRLLLSRPVYDFESNSDYFANNVPAHSETSSETEKETAFIVHFEKKSRSLNNGSARRIVDDYLDIRIILNAMVRRSYEMEPPESDRPIIKHISRYWRRADFALADRYPWITEVNRRLDEGDMFAVFRILLEYLFKSWGRDALCCHFDFDAVILYIARWELLSRWTTLDARKGKKIFDTILKEAIGDYDQHFN